MVKRGKVDLSIIIPAYNEAKRIGPTLKTILAYLNKKPWKTEIIVVDDGSKDKTAEVVKRYRGVRIIRQKNTGKGGAVRHGMLAANGKWRLFCDSDLSTPIDELETFWPLRKQYAVLIASRSLPESNLVVPQPFLRRFLGKGFSVITQMLVVPGVNDTQCGFKMFSERATKAIFPRQRETGWAFDVELLHIAQKKGFKIKEVPVRWIDSSESKVPWHEPPRMFTEVMRVRLRSWAGAYR